MEINLKKVKALKTFDDADNIIKVAIISSGVGKVIKTGIENHKYRIEFSSSNKFLRLGKDASSVLANALLSVSVTAARYLSAVNESLKTVEIVCHVGKDTHRIATPFNFLFQLKNETISVNIISDWVKIADYKFQKDNAN